MKTKRKQSFVHVALTGEGGDSVIKVTPKNLKQLKVLLKEYADTGEWADEINDILYKCKTVRTVGTINTMGDGGGWYDNDGEE